MRVKLQQQQLQLKKKSINVGFSTHLNVMVMLFFNDNALDYFWDDIHPGSITGTTQTAQEWFRKQWRQQWLGCNGNSTFTPR